MAYFAVNDLAAKKACILTDDSSDFSMALPFYFKIRYELSGSFTDAGAGFFHKIINDE